MSLTYQFDEFQLDTAEEILYRNGEKTNINRRTFQVLHLLIERAGEIVSKQEFFGTVWADTFVEDNSLTVTMTMLRKILGDNAKQPKFIESLPRKGYRFIAEVKIVEDKAAFVEIEDTNDKPPITSKTDKTRSDKLFSKKWKVLAGIVTACFLFLLIAFGFSYFELGSFSEFPANANQIRSIAVLPFENKNPDTEYLSDGLTESIINNLSGVSTLRVISRNSVFQYKNKPLDLAAIGRDLNVDAILTGRFARRNERLILNVELTDVRDNRQIWGREYQGGVADSFFLQQRISQDVSDLLRRQLSENDRKRLAKRETDDAEAYRFYLKGRYFLDLRTEENSLKAIDFFNQALQTDPTYAKAYIGLANAYALQSAVKISEDELAAMVEAAANKALEIDNSLGEAYAVLAFNNCFHKWNWITAEKQYRRAIELSPNYSTAHHWFAEFLALEGKFDESFAEYDRAVELDPLSLAIKTDLGFNYFYARQPDRAAEYLQNLKKVNPNYPRIYQYLTAVYQEKGMYNEAIDSLAAFYTALGDNTAIWIRNKDLLKSLVKTSGAKGYWQKMLQFNQSAKQSGPFGIAMMYAKLGDNDKAFEYLERSYSERSGATIYLKARPEFDTLRSDPRFADLARRVGVY